MHEPGLETLMIRTRHRLAFIYKLSEAVPEVDGIIIAVGTSSRPDGSVNTGYVECSACKVAEVVQACLEFLQPQQVMCPDLRQNHQSRIILKIFATYNFEEIQLCVACRQGYNEMMYGGHLLFRTLL